MKIIAIGRNYTEHAKEMNSPIPSEPVVFMKPDTALLRNNSPFYHPDFSNEIHYEVELVVKIKKVGKHIQKKFAHRYYNEIGIGIDLTARDVQRELKQKSMPWEKSKAFDFSAPIGKFVDKNNYKNLNNINFSLEVNNKVVQKSNSKLMIFEIDEIISYVSKFYTLKIGDLIFTGTPKGVGKINIGDKLIAKIENETFLDFEIK